MQRPIVIVGAGLAGLVCARHLFRRGHEVLIVEAGDRPGGRLRTDKVDGFTLDQGFQVYLNEYPHTEAELNEGALGLRAFEPGCLVRWDNNDHEVNRDAVLAMAMSTYLSNLDKIRLLTMSRELAEMDVDEILAMEDDTAEHALRVRGFSDRVIDRFFRPFFGGVFLDRSLQVSWRQFAFIWRTMNAGDVSIPQAGMEAIPQQIAADLPARVFRFGARVSDLVRDGGRVTGVRLVNGEVIDAEMVVVATDARAAKSLTGIASIPDEFHGSTTIYYAAPERPVDDPVLVANGNRPVRLNHFVCLSRIAPQRGNGTEHLISATVLGVPELSDDSLAHTVRYEIQSWYPKTAITNWRPLRVDRVPYAQLVQRPGLRQEWPTERTETEGLVLAGEFCANSSIDGAVLSGRRAADVVSSALAPATAGTTA